MQLESRSTFRLLDVAELKVLAAFQNALNDAFALDALHFHNNLLRRLCLFAENRFCLPAVTALLSIIPPFPLCVQRVLSLLVLDLLVQGVLLTSTWTESPPRLGTYDHVGLMSYTECCTGAGSARCRVERDVQGTVFRRTPLKKSHVFNERESRFPKDKAIRFPWFQRSLLGDRSPGHWTTLPELHQSGNRYHWRSAAAASYSNSMAARNASASSHNAGLSRSGVIGRVSVSSSHPSCLSLRPLVTIR
jgi:hypothetical protein